MHIVCNKKGQSLLFLHPNILFSTFSGSFCIPTIAEQDLTVPLSKESLCEDPTQLFSENWCWKMLAIQQYRALHIKFNETLLPSYSDMNDDFHHWQMWWSGPETHKRHLIDSNKFIWVLCLDPWVLPMRFC